MPIPRKVIPYDPHFLGSGIVVPLPEPTDELRAKLHLVGDSHVIDYVHFSLAMHAGRHTAIFSACNIDGRRIVKGAGGTKSWKLDDRLGNYQLGAEAYDGTAWDKGHLTKREDVIWGSPAEAKAANTATFFYSNAAPQHENFNRDEWKALEDWLFDWASEDHYRLNIITGPVLRRNDRRLSEGDPELRMIRDEILDPERIFIPAAFWKIAALRDKETDELTVAAFVMRQTDMWDDNDGSRLLRLKVHQVTVDAISRWTDLDFGPLHDADVLRVDRDRSIFARTAAGEAIWPIISAPEDLVQPVSRRNRNAGTSADRTLPAKRGCGCGGQELDVREALVSLNRDVARLAESVAAMQKSMTGAPALDRSLPRAAAPAMTSASPGGGPENRTTSAQEDEVARVLDRLRVDPATDALRIVGGREVEAHEFLSTCCIGSFDQFFCTGILVHPRVVVTAAHCTSDIAKAFFGSVIPVLGGDGTVMRVKSAVVHPDYSASSFVRNDINVLILAEDCAIEPTPIATASEITAAEVVELVGFGYNDAVGQLGFGTKRHVAVPMAAVRTAATGDLSLLERTLGFSSQHEFVAGRKLLGRDSCNGDSGGPAFVTSDGVLKVAGVTSRATREATRDTPCGSGGIYVRLDVYRDWITSVAGEFGIAL